MKSTASLITTINLVMIPSTDQDRSIEFYEQTLGQSTGVDADAEVTRMGDPVPPMFWFRDPNGNTLLIVEQT